MEITFLGHAGFLVETSQSILIMDPWLSENGAFDGGWFQFPRNHHMKDFVEARLTQNNNVKVVYVYVSHEHKDHYDLAYLKSIDHFKFTYLIPKYRRSVLLDQIKSASRNEIISCEDGQVFKLNNNESIKIYSEDSELNRDSAILFISGEKKFLNLNDCKIHDRLVTIKEQEGHIDVFAAQFSGATWHPTCYDYPIEVYEKISKKKKLSKFEATAIAIENVKPEIYIPSAGPACFIDPDLIHINFQKENIFPRNEQLISYLAKRLKKTSTIVPNIMPGDSITFVPQASFNEKGSVRINETNFEEYILDYAKSYKVFFDEIKKPLPDEDFKKLIECLIIEFKEKLSNFSSRSQINRPLFIKFLDRSGPHIKISFEDNSVELTDAPQTENFYLINVNSYDIKRVLDGYLTWEDYSLTFRMRLNREPDVYQVLMQGFLILEKEDMNYFCDSILEIENRTERIVVEVGGCKYKVDRYCPHQGADLTYAWKEGDKFLVCPRHRWAFNLENGGVCSENGASINAIPLEPD